VAEEEGLNLVPCFPTPDEWRQQSGSLGLCWPVDSRTRAHMTYGVAGLWAWIGMELIAVLWDWM